MSTNIQRAQAEIQRLRRELAETKSVLEDVLREHALPTRFVEWTAWMEHALECSAEQHADGGSACPTCGESDGHLRACALFWLLWERGDDSCRRTLLDESHAWALSGAWRYEPLPQRVDRPFTQIDGAMAESVNRLNEALYRAYPNDRIISMAGLSTSSPEEAE